MGTYLAEIVAAHRAAAQDQAHSIDELKAYALDAGPLRPFREALRDATSLAVIAEIKRRSPSKGDLAPELDPALTAKTYEHAGATCVSVLTDKQFFGGSHRDLGAARRACRLPLLRKDFTVCEEDVCEARWFGADAVLLIVAALGEDELPRFLALARELGLDALVEVHDEPELERALEAGADLIGVNQRDLTTFEVDADRAVRMASLIPDDVVKVAESGVRDGNDARRLRDAGFDAILVGESLVTATDVAAKLQELTACS